MYKLSLACAFLLASATTVLGCDTACSFSAEQGGRCKYYCADNVCYMSSSHHQSQFLTGLANRGYNCQPEGYAGVSCVKDSNFGACASHRWTCGKGC